MASQQTCRGILVACALLFGGVTVADAQATGDAAHYSGLDGNWFNPANWSTGAVPGRDTDVVLDGLDNVVVDPTRGVAEVAIANLRLSDFARLTTLPGMTFSARDERIGGLAELVHRSTGATEGPGGDLILEGAGELDLNPSTVNRRTVVLKSTIAVAPVVQFGLGGTAPAIAGRVGSGTHATLRVERAVLAGRLRVALHYGFAPRIGDRFQILTADAASGRFDNAHEGQQIAGFGDVGLFITYAGGDGNDVVLEAAPRRRLLGLL